MCNKIANQANHRKEYAVTTHCNVWYFYRYHPMLSNGTRELALPAYFELLPWGTFPVFTQRNTCHSLSLAVLLIFIESEPVEDFRVFTQTSLRLALSGEFLPAYVVHGASSGIAI